MQETRRPELDANGNCTVCGEHPAIHIRRGDVLPPRDFHRTDAPSHTYADEVA